VSIGAASERYAYGSGMAFYSALVIDEPSKEQNYDHKDLDKSKPVLRLSHCSSASAYPAYVLGR
jgi:hypothetical protein